MGVITCVAAYTRPSGTTAIITGNEHGVLHQWNTINGKHLDRAPILKGHNHGKLVRAKQYLEISGLPH